MEVKNIVKAYEWVNTQDSEGPYLSISEFFFDTIQGEGKYLGTPSAFLRLQGCPVNCKWCDTAAVWKQGSRLSIREILELMESSGLKQRFERLNYHLVITGGSPLLQQKALIAFFELMWEKWGFLPFVEVENECSIVPEKAFARYVRCWNNSPKLSNSEVPEERRVNLRACQEVDRLAREYGADCCWKFVVKDEEDVQEIFKTYSTQYWSFDPWDIYLMPIGANQEEYFANREKVVELAIKYDFRYSPREHIAIWDKKTGI